jgi:hypothetical protein
MRRTWKRPVSVALLSLGAALGGCGGDDEKHAVKSEEQARRAWEGIDGFVEQSIDLGFKGMNASSSGANIPAQTAAGLMGGMVTVVGKVDQGTSNNKNMDLSVGMVMFSNDGKIRYDTPADVTAQPKIVLSLKKIPTGDLMGTVTGSFNMSGDLRGAVTLNLTLAGKLEPDPATNGVRRKPGTTLITGSAESEYGRYSVNITR